MLSVQNSSKTWYSQLRNYNFKPNFKHYLQTWLAVFSYAVFTLLFLGFSAPVPSKSEPIVLQPQLLSITPQEFYIAQITDDRMDQSAIAWIYPPMMPKQKPVVQTIDLKGGTLNSIQNFVSKSLPENKNLRSVMIHLKECKITESITTPGRVNGKVALAVSFSLMAGPENIYLTEYRIDTKYNRPDNQLNILAPALQESFISAIKYFNNWMNIQADHNPKLAKVVQVDFKDYRDKTEGDTIYYAPNRPLTWNDFQEKPKSGKYAAVVFPSFAFDEHREVVNAKIRLHLDMKIYVPKSACWVKDGDRLDYTLNHEQRHFDLVAIVGKHFEQKIKAAKLPVVNFDGVINVAFYESFREMNNLQKLYDDETEHGVNASQQERWNKKIDQDLLALGIKHNL